jgi:hypothetical protein
MHHASCNKQFDYYCLCCMAREIVDNDDGDDDDDTTIKVSKSFGVWKQAKMNLADHPPVIATMLSGTSCERIFLLGASKCEYAASLLCTGGGHACPSHFLLCHRGTPYDKQFLTAIGNPNAMASGCCRSFSASCTRQLSALPG